MCPKPSKHPHSKTSPKTLTDEMLAARAQHGDGIAFGQLVQRHYACMVHIAEVVIAEDAVDQSSMLPSAHMAEALAQEAFALAHKKLRQLKAKQPFAPWLYRILIPLCLRAQIPSSPSYAHGPQAMQETLQEALQDHNVDVHALHKLPKIQRAILLLREWAWITPTDIGWILKLDAEKVLEELYLARTALMQEFVLDSLDCGSSKLQQEHQEHQEQGSP